jgi:hypothetical protein
MSDCACPSSQDKGSQQDQKKYEAAAEILDTGINQLQIAAMLLSLYWQKGGDSVYEMGKDAYELSRKLIALADAQSSSKLKICEEKEQVLGRLNHACLIVILRQQEDEAKKKQNAELARVVVERSKCCECLAYVDLLCCNYVHVYILTPLFFPPLCP